VKNRKMSSLVKAFGLMVAGALVLTFTTAAQQAGPQARAVRLSDVDGQVQLSQGNQVLASQAMVNAPLFEGTQISTSDDGRAEIQFEDGSVARVSPNSQVTLTTLRQEGSSADTEITLNNGLAYFEIQTATQPNHFRVRFGDNVVSASGFTIFRANLDTPPGEVAVFSGNAHIDGPNSMAVDIHGGQSLKLNGETAGSYITSEIIEPDSWDAWNSDRDQALTEQEAQRTTATANVPDSSNPAWSDLDANGNWYNVPGQGYVWSPNEAENAGWDPYGCGNWMWTPGYGYVWVSCESWGYMPYNSGAWSYYDGFGWGWAPGFGAPWWGGGIYVINIVRAPYLYKPPLRPHGGPVSPVRAGVGVPVHVTGGHFQPYPVVSVNRNSGVTTSAPVRPRSGPVTVAGNTVEPLRPISPRMGYMGANGTVRSSAFQGSTSNVSHPVYGFDTGSQGIIARPPGYNGTYGRPTAPSGTYNGYYAHPSAPSRGTYAPPPVSHPAGGGTAPHMSAPSGGAAPRAGGGGAGTAHR
jgi:FecR protein